MSVVYCGLFSRQGPILLAESTQTKSYSPRIMSLIGSMYKKENNSPIGTIEIENEDRVTYCRTKKLIFACVSTVGYSDSNASRFLQDRFIPKVMTEFNKDTEQIINPKKGETLTTLYHQSRLVKLFHTELDNNDTGLNKSSGVISKMDKDLNEIKTTLKQGIKSAMQDHENLEVLLKTTEKINAEAKEYKDNAEVLEYETRCIKPWMIITGIIILILAVAYIIISLIRCGNLNIFCVKASYKTELMFKANYEKMLEK